MKVSDVLTVTVSDSGMEGEGIAKVDGYVLFVPIALPGETVKIRINHLKKNFGYATLLKVISPSADRVVPPCPVYGRCGGCDMQHVAYDKQKQFKRKQVETCLKKNAGTDFPVAEVISGENKFAYRNKLQMPFGTVDGKVVLGFFKEGTHKVVPADKCILHGEWAEKLMRTVLAWANKNKISVYDELSGKGVLRHLVARNVGGKSVVVVVGNCGKLPFADLLATALKKTFGNDFKLYFSSNRKKTNVILGDSAVVIGGSDVKVDVGGVAVDVSPFTFLQVNDEVRDLIYDEVSGLVGDDNDVIVDAYSGMGIMTAKLSGKAKKAYGIEIVKEAVADANKLMKQNGITNVENICGDAAVELPNLVKKIREAKPKHFYHLAKSPFDSIKCGDKTFELRLYDQKRKMLKEGDVIEFECMESGEKLAKRVESIKVFDNFAALFAALGTGKDTCGTEMTEQQAISGMREYYSAEQEQSFGVCAIELGDILKTVAVVLDPPRKGCDEKTLAAVKEARPEKIVYVSCNPATLARDLAFLKTDFNIVSVQPYDMFPQTKHVETVVCLRKRQFQQ